MIKRLLIGIFVVLCLVLMVAVGFLSTLDLNLHKEKIQQLVFERTGRSLTIDGEIEARIYPWIGFQLNNVSLANADGFDQIPFASVRASDIQLELLPLLSGVFNVKWLQLHGLRLNLQVNEDGVANWEDLLATTTVVETETSEDDVLQSVEAGAPLAAALSVGRIEVTDAQVSWDDRKTSTDVEVTQLNLNTDAIQLGRPVDFTTSFDIRSNSFTAASTIEASGTLAIDLTSNSYSLQNFDIKTATRSGALPVEVLDASMSGDMRVNLKAQTLDLTNLEAEVETVPFVGELHGTGVFESPSFFGEFASESFNASSLLREFGLTLATDIDEGLLSDAAFSVVFQQTEEQILVKGLQLAVADAELSGDFQVSNLAQSPVLSGKLASNIFNPAPWLSVAGWRAADPLVLQRASLSAAVRQSGQILSLNDLQVTLDDFVLNGNIELTDIYAETPPLVFELRGTHLDVERYLPATDLNKEAPSPTVSTDDTLPVEQLRALDINGVVSLDKLSVAGLTITDIAVPLVAEEGNIRIAEAKAGLYGGTLFNSASIDLNVDEPLLKWSSNISAVQSEALLGDYLRTSSPISGTAILTIDMITRGINGSQWLQAADGAISLRFTDGALQGIDIGSEIRRVYALTLDEPFNVSDVNTTNFGELSVSAEINDGVLRSDDLSLKAPLLRMTGEGEVDLSTQEVDYLASVLVTDNPEGHEGQGEQEMEALRGLTLSVPVEGTLSELSIDFSDVLIEALTADFAAQFESQKAALASKVEEAVDTQRERVEEALLEKQETVEVLLEENKEVLIDQIQKKQDDVEQAVEETVDQLQQSIEKGISELLEK